jgi:hypothetical protein
VVRVDFPGHFDGIETTHNGIFLKRGLSEIAVVSGDSENLNKLLVFDEEIKQKSLRESSLPYLQSRSHILGPRSSLQCVPRIHDHSNKEMMEERNRRHCESNVRLDVK